ncbi:hypothetical protein TSAR_002641, partial [Trichomalopsis sarcophagae]
KGSFTRDISRSRGAAKEVDKELAYCYNVKKSDQREAQSKDKFTLVKIFIADTSNNKIQLSKDRSIIVTCDHKAILLRFVIKHLQTRCFTHTVSFRLHLDSTGDFSLVIDFRQAAKYAQRILNMLSLRNTYLFLQVPKSTMMHVIGNPSVTCFDQKITALVEPNG